MAPLPKEVEKATEDNISQQKQMDEFFEWAAAREPETMTGKLKRKVKENPLVPVGAVCTLGALAYGLFSFVRGDQKMQQYMMRTRVAAQGGTLVAVVAGVFYMLYQERQAKGGKT